MHSREETRTYGHKGIPWKAEWLRRLSFETLGCYHELKRRERNSRKGIWWKSKGLKMRLQTSQVCFLLKWNKEGTGFIGEHERKRFKGFEVCSCAQEGEVGQKEHCWRIEGLGFGCSEYAPVLNEGALLRLEGEDWKEDLVPQGTIWNKKRTVCYALFGWRMHFLIEKVPHSSLESVIFILSLTSSHSNQNLLVWKIEQRADLMSLDIESCVTHTNSLIQLRETKKW